MLLGFTGEDTWKSSKYVNSGPVLDGQYLVDYCSVLLQYILLLWLLAYPLGQRESMFEAWFLTLRKALDRGIGAELHPLANDTKLFIHHPFTPRCHFGLPSKPAKHVRSSSFGGPSKVQSYPQPISGGSSRPTSFISGAQLRLKLPHILLSQYPSTRILDNQPRDHGQPSIRILTPARPCQNQNPYVTGR